MKTNENGITNKLVELTSLLKDEGKSEFMTMKAMRFYINSISDELKSDCLKHTDKMMPGSNIHFCTGCGRILPF